MDDILKSWIEAIFGGINASASSITGQITMSPAQALGQDFWDTLLKIGATIVMPFAIIIMCYAMAAELYNVYVKANGELDLQLVSTTAMRFILPFICITKTYDLLQLIFNYFNSMLTHLGAAVGAGTAGKLTDASALINSISGKNIFDKLILMVELMPLQLGMQIMTLVVTVIVYGRIIEIVIYWIFAPIPFATFTHSEFSQVGKNFIKIFAAVLLQGGFMIITVTIYSLLINEHAIEATVNGGWVLMGYGAVLIVTLATTGKMSKKFLGTF